MKITTHVESEVVLLFNFEKTICAGPDEQSQDPLKAYIYREKVSQTSIKAFTSTCSGEARLELYRSEMSNRLLLRTSGTD